MQDRWKLWAGLGVGALVLLSAGTAAAASPSSIFNRYSFGGRSIKKGIDRDPENLLPPFARKIEKLFQRMRARGFKPMLWEGYRSPQRAAALASKEGSTAIKRSMHIHGAAVDIVDADRLWNASPAFWSALGEEARKLGLTWGGVWRSKDRPHVQAVTVAEQPAFRRMSDREQLLAVA